MGDDTPSRRWQMADARCRPAEILASRCGEMVPSYIVLSHELIHSYHGLDGMIKNDDAERWTTGIGVLANEAISENVSRKQFGLPPRLEYY